MSNFIHPHTSSRIWTSSHYLHQTIIIWINENDHVKSFHQPNSADPATEAENYTSSVPEAPFSVIQMLSRKSLASLYIITYISSVVCILLGLSLLNMQGNFNSPVGSVVSPSSPQSSQRETKDSLRKGSMASEVNSCLSPLSWLL